MNNTFVSTVIKYGSELIEGYRRKTRASPEELERLGLDSQIERFPVVGVAGLQEYVIFQSANIPDNESRTFDLSKFGDDLCFVSLYVENTTDDDLWIEAISPDNQSLIKQRIGKNKSPFFFPDNPIPSYMKIRITALRHISFVRLAAKTCKIIETFYSEEEYAVQSQ
jgi:hypothetical protein